MSTIHWTARPDIWQPLSRDDGTLYWQHSDMLGGEPILAFVHSQEIGRGVRDWLDFQIAAASRYGWRIESYALDEITSSATVIATYPDEDGVIEGRVKCVWRTGTAYCIESRRFRPDGWDDGTVIEDIEALLDSFTAKEAFDER